RRRIAGAVVEQVAVGIVGHPSPHRRTAVLPHVGGPARERQLGAPIVERLERSRLRQDLAIGTDVVGGPYDPARLEIESLEPAVNAELAARRADDDPTLHDEGRDRRGLALREVRDLGLHSSLPVAAATATVCPSSRLYTILPSA